MIPGEPSHPAGAPQDRGAIAIDELFRRAAARRPDATALVDAPDRERFTEGEPRRLSYGEADRVVSAIAGRLRRLGLPTDTVVGIQLPNTVENVLTILGVLRAGMIAAPLPLLWRRADAVAALSRVGAKALVSCKQVGGFEHCQLAARIAADVFSIRYVCGFGTDLPDGAVPFDDLFTAARPEPVPPLGRDGDAAAHLAFISFDVGEDGPVPVARRHLELLAGGLSVLLEASLQRDAIILSSIAPVSFAGACLTLVPWLLTGGTLVLHHPFDADVLARQRRDERCGTLILPAPAVFALADANLFARENPATFVAAWRAPEWLAASPHWRLQGDGLVDVAIFGEAGLLAARRGADGRPAPLPSGPVGAPRGQGSEAMRVAELVTTAAGTLALGGPMVPRQAFPPGIEHSDQPYFAIGPDGTVDTGYQCRADTSNHALVVTGSPTDIVSVGGYRFPLCGLLETIGRIDKAATIAATSDPVMGQRLIGTAADRVAMQAALDAMGLNPLVAMAFASRGDRVLRETMAVA